MTKTWNSRASLLLGASVLLFGCGNYTSDYVPPKDGRARAVWNEDRVVASIPSDSSPSCTEALYDVQGDPQRYYTTYGGTRTVVVWQPWIVVHHHHNHHGGGRVGPGLPGGSAYRPARPSVGGGGGGTTIGGGGHSGGGSGGGNGDLGKAAVVLAVVAIIALPIITLGLGLGRPEPSEEVAQEIDQVNAYNDLARLPNSPCLVGVSANGGE